MDETTTSSVPIKDLYTPEDLKHFDYTRDLNYPGKYPFTRGIYPSMYRGQLWTMRQFAGFGMAEDTNERYKYLLEHGETGLSVAFDLPTLYGYDSDSKFSKGEVGKCGVAIDTLRDMEILFDGIPLNRVSTSMTINPPASILLAMYIAVAEKQGVNKRNIRGTIQNDILKEFIAQKTLMCPLHPSMKLIVDTIEFCTNEIPGWHPVSISGYHIREAGATAVQELAFTLADGIAYVQGGIERGIDVDDFAPRLSFFFDSHLDFFEEISKFRAARRMWAKIMKERFNANNPKSLWLRFHTQTAGCSLTSQQPYNNIVRTSFEALAAVLGGTQSLHTNSLDETYTLPTEESATIALRTQQIIADEIGVTHAIDPLGGSYYVESLTNKIEGEAWNYINKIDALGGMIKAIDLGYPQQEIANAAYEYQRKIERQEKTIVGVNKYTGKEENPITILTIDPSIEKKQTERLQHIKKIRSNERVKHCLEDIKHAAEQDENLMPPLLLAVKEYASLQEICDTLRNIFGTYEDKIVY